MKFNSFIYCLPNHMKKKNLKSNKDERELTTDNMVKGIGRQATNKELINYLSKDKGNPIDLKIIFSKYENK